MRATLCLAAMAMLCVFVACGDDTTYVPPSGPGASATSPTYEMTADRAFKFMQERCTACHTTTPIKKAKMTAEEWGVRIDTCKAKGAMVGPADRNALAAYLGRTQGP
jgi:uncharacterized membrane protein